jgi:hypothetical protein
MIENYGLKSEVLYVSKLDCAKFIPTASKKISERTEMERPWLNSWRHFQRGTGVCLEGAGFVGLILPGRSKEFTYTFLWEGFEEPVHLIKGDQAPIHDQPPAYGDDCA